MASNEFLKESLEYYKQQRIAKTEEVRTLDITIRQILMDLGEPVEQVDLAFPGGIAEAKYTPAPAPARAANNYKPRLDEFFQKSIAEASLEYLDKIGHAMSAEDILKAITSGGCKVGGADPKRTLSITLGQSKRDFVSTGGGNYGLRKFYNMPKLGRPEGSAPVKKAAKRRTKKLAKRSTAPKVSAKAPAHDPVAVGAAITEVLSDHKAKNADEVLAAVVRRVGHPVKKIALYSTLRKKEFEQIGDKYRLRQPAEGPQVVQ